MINQSAIEFLEKYRTQHPDNLDKEGNPYFSNIFELLEEIFNPSYEEEIFEGRWWTTKFCVQEINNNLIGFDWAYTQGDWPAKDKGWEFNEDSLCFVEPYQVVLTKYRKIKDK